MLSEGSIAPSFSLEGSDGKPHSISEFKGRYLVLYFYPKDDTPGCTIEAKGFNSKTKELASLGASVVGVSKDGYESHCKFVQKYGLKFLLLSDASGETIKKYDAYGNRGVFGPGTLRKTYIIDEKGRLAKIFPKVTPLGHEKEIIKSIKDLEAQED